MEKLKVILGRGFSLEMPDDIEFNDITLITIDFKKKSGNMQEVTNLTYEPEEA